MEPIALNDPTLTPDDTLIATMIGERYTQWRTILDHLNSHYDHISEIWRFYNDGKCWLFRVLHKKDTVCWIGVEKETFRVSVSIHEKWADVIEASELPEDCKLQFRTARVFNHTRSITVVIRDEQDAQTVLALTALKLKYKG